MNSPLSARAALLQALAIPGYGIELIERVRRGTHGHVRLRMGSVYPALSRLERERLVRCTVVAPARGAGRPRKYYELTPRGVAAAMAERRALLAFLRGDLPPISEPVEALSARLRRAAELSASLVRLRQVKRRRSRRTWPRGERLRPSRRRGRGRS